MSPKQILHEVAHVPPQWWGAIAGAVAAGAVLVPNHRVLAGAGAGVAMLLLAVRPWASPAASTPCCQECAEGAPCAGGGGDAVQVAAVGSDLMTNIMQAQAIASGAKKGCGG